jgi:hypothetical protein
MDQVIEKVEEQTQEIVELPMDLLGQVGGGAGGCIL